MNAHSSQPDRSDALHNRVSAVSISIHRCPVISTSPMPTQREAQQLSRNVRHALNAPHAMDLVSTFHLSSVHRLSTSGGAYRWNP